MRSYRPLPLLGLLAACAAPAAAQDPMLEPDARMLRTPDVSADSIVFGYAQNLWSVPRAGGVARKLTSHSGAEVRPRFSPDGQTLAFSAGYQGNLDVYTMPATGGAPQRVTWHPGADALVDWTPDGRALLVRSDRRSPSRRYDGLFRVPAGGGLAEPMPLPIFDHGSPSPDGRSIVFQPLDVPGRNWKRYRGGNAPELWELNLDTLAAQRIAPSAASDHSPMWYGDRIYFVSDRDGRSNLYCYERAGGALRRVTAFDEYDVFAPCLGPDAIVFENGGRLFLLHLPDERLQPVRVQLWDDAPQALPQVKSVAAWLDGGGLSPSGKRAVLGARGDVFTLPAKDGRVRNLTASPGVAERYPAWSPDGRWIAYFSDRSGEYELTLLPAEGGEEKQVTRLGPGWRYHPEWSPDSGKIAFGDHLGRLWIVTVADGSLIEVDRDPMTELRDFAWSPDSRWLAYGITQPNAFTAIHVYDLLERQGRPLTSGFSPDFWLAFDPQGRYLWFASFRSWSPSMGMPNASFTYQNGAQVYALALRRDVPAPTAPRSDEEPPAAAAEPAAAPAAEAAPPPAVTIDFEGAEERAVALPLPAADYGNLAATAEAVYYLRREPNKKPTLYRWSLEERKEETVLEDVENFALSAKGEHLLYFAEGAAGVVAAAPGQNKDAGLALGQMSARIEPRAEWAQIYREAWRLQRDFFYDEGLHGVDWPALGARYERLLPYVASRDDLDVVLGDLIGELCSSHAYVEPGDVAEPKQVPIGLLGCDYELDAASGHYRIGKIYRGEPGLSQAPLAQPGMDVRSGDYLLAIDGRPVRAPLPPYAFCEGLAGQPVRVAVAAAPDGAQRREFLVVPLADERELRFAHWVRERREYVAAQTGGQVGYVYVPDTGADGLNLLVRQYLAQFDRPALIIDERWNSGGMIPDRFVELLARKPLSFWARRGFEPYTTPDVYHDGPKVMLINEWCGSGGDAFPYYFRAMGAGPLVGKRTYGALIGISNHPSFIDGGAVTVPMFSFWDPYSGAWEVENEGVHPDVEVDNTPSDLARGLDPQLDRAIAIALEQLQAHPPLPRVRPAPVVR